MARPVRKLEDIEAAAIRLFAERGVGRVTTKEIAREAGCAEGALYRHYAGMDEMAWRLFKREVEKFGRTLKEILEQDISYSERIHQSVSFFYRFFDKDPVTFRFILLSEHQFPLPQKIDRKFNPDTLVFEFVRKGVRDGIFHIREGDLGAAMILGLVLMPATLRATGKLAGPLSKRIGPTTRASWKVLNIQRKDFKRKNNE